MKIILILLLLFIVSCASQNPGRKIASPDLLIQLGKADSHKSLVQIFPAMASDSGIWYYFYVQLKDQNGNYVDCSPADLALKTNKGKQVAFTYEREATGRYYLTVEKTLDIRSAHLNFFVQGESLKEQFKLHFEFPSKQHTSMAMVEKRNNSMKFQLRLADKKNQPLDMPDSPEIMFEGIGHVEGLKEVKEGIWEFSVNYPSDNQIMYFSVRAMGVFMPKLLRYQHIEK